MPAPLFKQVKIEIPTIPNFIKVGEVATPINQFSEEELRDIGEEWTQRLILKGKEPTIR